MDSSFFAPGVGGAAAGPIALDDLTDVTVPSPNDGDVLVYDDGDGQWKAEALAAGALVAGMFEAQEPVPGSYHHPKGVHAFDQQGFGFANAMPIVFAEDTDVEKLGTYIFFNGAVGQGFNAEGLELRLFIYESNEDGLPATLVTGSDKLRTVPQGYDTPPAGAFSAQAGLLSWDLPSPVTLTAGTRYWIGGAVQAAEGSEYSGGQPPRLTFARHSGIGPTPFGDEGVPAGAAGFFPAISSAWMQLALTNESWDIDSALPATISPGGGVVSGFGPGLFVSTLVAAPSV